jgi:hypothetical protein
MEQGVPTTDRVFTEAEYLRLEAASTVKHEFPGGRIIAMAGGSHGHGIIALNLGVRSGNDCVTNHA